MEKIKIDLGFATLVAERGNDEGYKEIFIGLEDKNGAWLQDLAIVGQKYHYDLDSNVVNEKGINVMVYSDVNDEDYTHKFDIDIYEEEE